MKRLNNLVPLICTTQNFEQSIKQVLRGSKRKKTKNAKYILKHKEEIINQDIATISTGSFKLGEYRQEIIKEGVKERQIQILGYRDRIIVNAVMSILDNLLVKRMIKTTAASIKDRGTIYLKNIIQRDIRKDSEGTTYYYKLDIAKYYQNIDHTLMKKCIRHYIKDNTILVFLNVCIDMLPEGLSIGLRASQVLGNILLSWILDQNLKSKERLKYYYRYCDDIVIFSSSKESLWEIHHLISKMLLGTKLSIKPNYAVKPLKCGLDFLGFVIYSGVYCRVRKRIKCNAQRKLSRIKSRKRRQEVIAGIKGYCLHSNGHHLFNTLIA